MELTKKPKSRLKKIVLILFLCVFLCILLYVSVVAYEIYFVLEVAGDSIALTKEGVDKPIN